MKKALDYLTAKPARFFLLAALIWGGLMCYLNYKDGTNFAWHDLLVEANGMVFDLLVFGILLSVYDALREKKEKTERLHEEIDDYRGWDEKEATYRIAGAVKRLNILKVYSINLSDCYLKGANLKRTNLQGARLIRANLQEAKLFKANLEGAHLAVADLKNAILRGAKLMDADISEADLNKADLQGANLKGADLLLVDLQGANLDFTNLQNTNLYRANLADATLLEADLQGANLEEAKVVSDEALYVGKKREEWFRELENWNTKGIEEIKAKYLIDENGKLQLK